MKNKFYKIIILLFLIFPTLTFANEIPEITADFVDRLKFFLVLIPAAIGDSINPCAFAVMFILLSSILKSQKSKKTVFLAGILFTLAVFISYLAMGLGLYKALATTDKIFYLKLVV
ncbi:MAG: hypothetical protein LBU14_00170 [Candidatus Peribacteria bacterium]|jgi:cytochrome c biogenesis protein CcdA|nr:hypothetical protein [Candidatus Peribacteria bacterium]